MTDYNTLKVPDLKKLLQTRSLPVSGNKAELVARLQEDDNKAQNAKDETKDTTETSASKAEGGDGDAPSKTSASVTKNDSAKTGTTGIAPPGDDEIDWGDDEPTNASAGAATSKPSADAIAAAGGQGAATNPTAVPNQKADFDPSKTSDLTVKYPAASKASAPKQADASAQPTAAAASTNGQDAAADAGPTKPSATDFTAGLGTTDLDAEIAKRKARAKRFQTGNNTEEDKPGEEAIKALERAKRFGLATTATTGGEAGAGANGTAGQTSVAGVRGLDQALPERGPRKRGRDRDGDDGRTGGGAGKRRRGGGRGGDGAGPRDRRGNAGGRTRNVRRGNAGGARQGRITDDPAEKAKAEARAKKFATSTTTDNKPAATATA